MRATAGFRVAPPCQGAGCPCLCAPVPRTTAHYSFPFLFWVFLQASGILKGFDPLLNLVLDGTVEYMRDPDDQYKLTEDTRQLGLVVCRGTSVVLICPQDGMEAIPNPFIQQQDA
nr:U6 snRNA-associated Sm-like protein LSm7 [Vulpes vulpes]